MLGFGIGGTNEFVKVRSCQRRRPQHGSRFGLAHGIGLLRRALGKRGRRELAEVGLEEQLPLAIEQF